jgi:hypothetical protein
VNDLLSVHDLLFHPYSSRSSWSNTDIVADNIKVFRLRAGEDLR